MVAKKSDDLSKRQINTFLSAKLDGEVNNNIIISVETEQDKSLLEKALQDNLSAEIERELKKSYNIHINASSGSAPKNSKVEQTEVHDMPKKHDDYKTVEDSSSNLLPIFTFENYVVGESNKLAHASSVKASESPGNGVHNPLYIYGDSGLGKTHLLHAIGNNALVLNDKIKVLYCSSEMFVNEYVGAILKKGDNIERFNQKYRTLDILLLDDIQFFAEKDGSAQTFFHIFNSLVNSNKQVVVASDVPPNMLKGFHQRMVSRFEGSVYWGITEPDNVLRVAYIKKYLSDAVGTSYGKLGYTMKVIDKIANLLKTSIREIEGALARIISYCSVNKVEVSEEIVDIVLHDQILDRCSIITLDDILVACAEFYGFQAEDIQGKKRSPALVSARHMSMYLSRKLTNLTLVEVGRFYKKDHSSIINAEKKMKAQIKEKPKVYQQVNEIVDKIKKIVDKT
ncbi:MAG: chromosomal replication initiator protein DnaA [Candidatus Ancillula sp.]|nr:chromosomal replication initiator protein DnaA [Candidatus Ancillula sp.]